VPGKPRSWIVISPNTELALAKMRELLATGTERRLSSQRTGTELDRSSLFGAMVSTELLDAGDLEFLAPAARRSWSRFSIEGQRTLVLGARVPGGDRRSP
jgi:hypothetical protein